MNNTDRTAYALSIASAAYDALPTIEFYDTYADGAVKITRADGETITYRIETTNGRTSGYTLSLYSIEGDAYKIDSGTAIGDLRAAISEWANADTTNAN